MSAVPKTESEPTSNATTHVPHNLTLVADKKSRSVDQPQGEPNPDLVAPSKASTFVVAVWVVAVVAVAGSIIWAALANPA
jgi:hypothetical protein